MKKGKRDQRQYDLVQQHLPGLILGTILRIVEDLGDPYQAKPGPGGTTAYQPKSMAVACISMDAEARTCRKMVGHLRINPNLVRKVGLPRIPSKSTIRRAYGMIPEAYLREIHTRIIGDVMVTGSLAGDSPATPATGSFGGSASATTRSGSSAAGSSCTASSTSPPGPS